MCRSQTALTYRWLRVSNPDPSDLEAEVVRRQCRACEHFSVARPRRLALRFTLVAELVATIASVEFFRGATSP